MNKFFSTSLSVDRLKCLRNDCTLNDCRKCIDFCPYNAFSLTTAKLSIIEENCTKCTACIGVCPSEAISSDGFEPSIYILKEFSRESDRVHSKTCSKKLTLKCSQIGSCLSSFDEQHLITLVIRSSREVEIDLSECKRCPLNEGSSKVLEQITHVSSETNRFLGAIEFKKQLKVVMDSQNDRRAFLYSIFTSAQSIKDSFIFEPPKNSTKIPLKTVLLKNSLRDISENISLKLNESFSFLNKKNISQSCTNCRACVEFCPTNALFYSSEYDKIYFQSGKCVNCDICHSICKDNSFSNESEFDLVRFMFDKATCIIEHDIQVCDHCKNGFASKNGATTCPICMNFKTDFATMFLTAEEISRR